MAAAKSQTNPVEEFLRKLRHPLKAEILEVRKAILSVSPEISEDIKWNAPSFRTKEFFATFHLRSQREVVLILHRGAKVKDNSTTEMKIADPQGLLRWLAKERALATLGAGKTLAANLPALKSVIREWIRYV